MKLIPEKKFRTETLGLSASSFWRLKKAGEYRQKVEKKVREEGKFWDWRLTRAADIAAKIDGLDELVEELALCLEKTRMAAWQVLSLFPGELHLRSRMRAHKHPKID